MDDAQEPENSWEVALNTVCPMGITPITALTTGVITADQVISVIQSAPKDHRWAIQQQAVTWIEAHDDYVGEFVSSLVNHIQSDRSYRQEISEEAFSKKYVALL